MSSLLLDNGNPSLFLSLIGTGASSLPPSRGGLPGFTVTWAVIEVVLRWRCWTDRLRYSLN